MLDSFLLNPHHRIHLSPFLSLSLSLSPITSLYSCQLHFQSHIYPPIAKIITPHISSSPPSPSPLPSQSLSQQTKIEESNMTEFINQIRITMTQFSSLLCFMYSFMLSHPLYFSYFIFFSPYLLKLLSFLSPLFITTTTLLLILSPLIHPQITIDSKDSFLISTMYNVLQKLQSITTDDNGFEEFSLVLELKAYEILFGPSNFELKEEPIEDVVVYEDPVSISDISQSIKQGFGEEIRIGPESVIYCVEEKEVIKSITYIDKVDKQKEEQQPSPSSLHFLRNGSNAKSSRMNHSISIINANHARDDSGKFNSNNFGEYSSKSIDKSESWNGNFEKLGSMRREKEWSRTLAGKIFEERHNVNGRGEGMDSLWELYETDSDKMQRKLKNSKSMNRNTWKKTSSAMKFDDEEDDDDEEEVAVQLCCLQALKLSSGKMSFGMGKPNIVRFSKALKSFRWLRHGSKIKHGQNECI